jgi:very-short-patch-repair endonuclease
MDHESPLNLEDLLSSAVDGLKSIGDARAIAILVTGTSRFIRDDSDFGVLYWRLLISLPSSLYFAMTEDEKKNSEETISRVVEPFFGGLTHDSLCGVKIAPSIENAKNGWRERALAFVKGEGVTNQGRVRSDNIASKQDNGLLFRSNSEITLFKALLRARLPVAPLPVFVRIGNHYNRIEPDFVVIYKGLTFVIEVDGDTYHKESPSDADKRLIPLTYEGVEVRRINASDLETDKAADGVVSELIKFMTNRKDAR